MNESKQKENCVAIRKEDAKGCRVQDAAKGVCDCRVQDAAKGVCDWPEKRAEAGSYASTG